MSELDLKATLIDLHERLSKRGVEIILGGGFGLYLKQLHLMTELSPRTLIPVEAWPNPRTTSDLDVFFPLEVLVNLDEMKAVRNVIDEMRFSPIVGSEYWRFELAANGVKIDLLTGQIDENVKPKLKADARRARPKGDLELHAHPIPEALDLSRNLESVSLSGQLSDGADYSTMVKIPSPFTYLMMKVTAFGDQVSNEDKNLGRHHALDVYRIVAMLTEAQFRATKQQFRERASSDHVRHVQKLVRKYFGTEEPTGVLRIKEHSFFTNAMQLSVFTDSIADLLR